jgi:hypothetical protein
MDNKAVVITIFKIEPWCILIQRESFHYLGVVILCF